MNRLMLQSQGLARRLQAEAQKQMLQDVLAAHGVQRGQSAPYIEMEMPMGPISPVQEHPLTRPQEVAVQQYSAVDQAAEAEYFGFPLTDVAAGATANIQARPQRDMRPTKLYVADGIAGSFVMTSLKIGVDELMASTDPMPLTMFTGDQTLANFRGYIAKVGLVVTIVVTNVTAGLVQFAGGMAGRRVVL